MGLFKKISKWGAGLAAFSAAGLASAAASQPKDWQITFQEAASENMTMITDFNNFLLILMTAISVFVLGLMLYVMVRFNARANPEPSKTTHNTLVEVIWTVVPIVILVVIAIPSFRLLYFQRDIPEADMTVKAVGYQWYWGYEYPDHGDFAFDSLMLTDEERGDQPRLLATDTAMVVPVDTTVRVIVTAADVLHAFAMPAFGLKMDAVPGRLNETWFKAEKPALFTANAPSFAAFATPLCRYALKSYRKPISPCGWKKRKMNMLKSTMLTPWWLRLNYKTRSVSKRETV